MSRSVATPALRYYETKLSAEQHPAQRPFDVHVVVEPKPSPPTKIRAWARLACVAPRDAELPPDERRDHQSGPKGEEELQLSGDSSI